MNMFLYIPTWLNNLLNALTNIVNPILIVAVTAGIIYAIWVGIKFVKADEKNEREEAKQKLITVIVGVVVTGILIALFYFLKWAITSGLIKFDDWFDTTTTGGGTTGGGTAGGGTAGSGGGSGADRVPFGPNNIGGALKDTVGFYANGFRAMFM